MILFINVIIMPSSFFMTYFMHDKPSIVNHNLCLYSMFLFLSRIIFLFSFFIYWPWNLLFCTIYKRQKIWKIFPTCCGVFNLLVVLYIFCGIGKHSLISFSIF